jgi:hypothetical protein
MRRSLNQLQLIPLIGILLIATSCIVVIAQDAAKTAGRIPIVLNTKPVRVVSDSSPVLSGISIDTQRDEVFMTNDKESSEPSVMVYPHSSRPQTE